MVRDTHSCFAVRNTFTHPCIGGLHVLLVDGVFGPLIQHFEQVHPLAGLQVRLQRGFVRSPDCKTCEMHPNSDQLEPC